MQLKILTTLSSLIIGVLEKRLMGEVDERGLSKENQGKIMEIS